MLGAENRTRNKPPPGGKRVGDWKGMRVRSLRELRNGYGSMPAGTLFEVESATIGLSLRSLPCACCGIRFTISKVGSQDVEPAPADGVGDTDGMKCRYTDQPGGACWRQGKAVELCTCHGMSEEAFKASVAAHAAWHDAGLRGNAGVNRLPSASADAVTRNGEPR